MGLALQNRGSILFDDPSPSYRRLREHYAGKPVIFLDMDGVLCTPRAAVATRDSGLIRALDPLGIAFLNRLCEDTGAVYVVSSTWRKEIEVPLLLQAAGVRGDCHVDWRTDEHGPRRGDEIQRWLDAHPDVTNFVILDDDTDFLESQKARHVKTDVTNGMMLEHYESARNILTLGPRRQPAG